MAALAAAAAAAGAAAAAQAARAAEEAAERAVREVIERDPKLTKEEAEATATTLWVTRTTPFLGMLGDPNRLSLIIYLRRHGETDVGTLSRKLGIPQSRTSQHLGKLAKSHLVVARRVGQSVLYTLNADYVIWKLGDVLEHLK